MHRRKPLLAAAFTIGALVVTAAVPAAAAEAPAEVVVRAGGSIQAALDHVAAGGTVTVRPGTYAENLVIDHAVTLHGLSGVRLVPPDTIVDNVCTRDPDAEAAGGTEIGICVIGDVDATYNPPVVQTLLGGVRISGLTVAGFKGIGVEAYATRGLRLEHVIAEHNAGGGFWAAQSPGAQLDGVVARGNGTRGINLQWSDDGALVRSSTSVGNLGDGIFVGDSTGVTVSGNRVANNCAGVVVADIWSPIPGAGVGRVTITDNNVMANNLFCAGDPSDGEPSESGTGVALAGASDSVVAHNRVLGNVARQPADLALGGIAVLDSPFGSVATGNTVTGNVVLRNQPADLLFGSAGAANTFTDNVCTTTSDEEVAPCTR